MTPTTPSAEALAAALKREIAAKSTSTVAELVSPLIDQLAVTAIADATSDPLLKKIAHLTHCWEHMRWCKETSDAIEDLIAATASLAAEPKAQAQAAPVDSALRDIAEEIVAGKIELADMTPAGLRRLAQAAILGLAPSQAQAGGVREAADKLATWVESLLSLNAEPDPEDGKQHGWSPRDDEGLKLVEALRAALSTPSPEAREPEPYGWILSNGLQGGAWNRGPQCPPGWRDIPGAKPFYLDAPVPPEQPSMPECWSVVVGDGSRALVSIGHNWLAGKSDLTYQDEQTIIGAAKHLLSFVGYGLPPSDFAPEARETAEPKFATDRSFGWCPDQCPITRLPFFMWIQHPRDGWVPTYGGPLDSYTIPVMGGLPTEPFHERPLERERFDHDAGYWVDGVEEIPLRVAHDDALAAPVSQAEPVMANGLTEAETNATASVAGLSQAEPERTCREPWVCVNCFSDQGPCLGPKSQAEPSTSHEEKGQG